MDIPSDDGLALAHAIEDGTAVGASDGSVINTFDTLYGGSAATIQQQHSDTAAFSCYSPSPHSSQLCSLTTELYGFITATILIHTICIAHGLGDGIVTIYIYIYNSFINMLSTNLNLTQVNSHVHRPRGVNSSYNSP